jgi:hypothetical protein
VLSTDALPEMTHQLHELRISFCHLTHNFIGINVGKVPKADMGPDGGLR